VAIIPIIFKGKEKSVMDACNVLHKKLEDKKIRSHVDERDITPGSKYYDWELKGVPLRVEIGPKDLEQKQIVLVRRDTGKKMTAKQDGAEKTIKNELDKIGSKLFDNAKDLLNKSIHRVTTIEEAKEKEGIVELPWCGNEDCALEIENILEGNTLGEPIEDEECKQSCPVCNDSAKTWMRYAKTYLLER
jgi:prolyl-tRNA synthetase